MLLVRLGICVRRVRFVSISGFQITIFCCVIKNTTNMALLSMSKGYSVRTLQLKFYIHHHNQPIVVWHFYPLSLGNTSWTDLGTWKERATPTVQSSQSRQHDNSRPRRSWRFWLVSHAGKPEQFMISSTSWRILTKTLRTSITFSTPWRHYVQVILMW